MVGDITLIKYREYVVECGEGMFWLNTVSLILWGIYMCYTLWKNRHIMSMGNLILCVSLCALFLIREYIFVHYQTSKYCDKEFVPWVSSKYTLNFMVEISGGHMYLRFINSVFITGIYLLILKFKRFWQELYHQEVNQVFT